jgi:aspartate racemase
MKTIGILGELGPQATMDFEARLQDERTLVFPLQPDPDLLQAAQWLGTRADFLVITANGPHIIQAQIEQAAGRKVLSMIKVTLQDIQQRGWRKIGVLGFGPPDVPIYTRTLGQLNLAAEVITPELQDPLNVAVIHMQEGRANEEDTQAVREAATALRARQADGIILGCTELPLLLPAHVDEPDLINPTQLLAEAAVRFALG